MRDKLIRTQSARVYGVKLKRGAPEIFEDPILIYQRLVGSSGAVQGWY